ncbi:hypothetical protein [Bradyrhizobium sp. ORS 375]|uniref:hypothetical protein n=1 Tax=Bradyrhizobium sp. (strain ORS 375) TaxID=566679 RepID=UPI001FCAEACE|nr:hypothetical protein [Bradyrhizobium sp. ORS 375]
MKSLDKEFEHWKRLTDDEGLGLRRHYSQVRRLETVLNELTASVRKDLGDLPPQSAVLDRAVSLENRILAAHSIWEVFRTKLVLREDGMFRGVLAACDDLAWECYGPAVQRFDRGRKGPPLVYFSATWSPFMVPRDSSFQNEVRAGPGAAGALRDDAFLEVLKRLPIPLIGVPWYHTVHLPGALVIAHEVGHVVEFDFALTPDIATALSNAGLDHMELWIGWASEAFADLYGCLCMGPSFVGAMMDLLTTSVASVQQETRSSGKYPARALRIELMLNALTQTGHSSDAVRLRKTWEDVYGTNATVADFAGDVAKVVRAIYKGPYRNLALTDIISYTADPYADRLIGEAAALGSTTDLVHHVDPRRLFAGAQWLHENPQADQDPKAYDLIVEQLGKRHAQRYRSDRGEPVEERAVIDTDVATRSDADRRSGRDLVDFLATVPQAPP